MDMMTERASRNGQTMSSEIEQLHPFLRDVTISLVPYLRDDQFRRISAQIHRAHPDALISRLSEFSILVQGIPVRCGSPHDADIHAWDRAKAHVREALCGPEDAGTRVTSIEVTEARGLL
jgi:hypothetical protein